MPSGNGKIANLPSEIREELNYRLSEGEPGTELVEWLNAKPEVIKVIAERFDGRPISEQNLSQWRTHGYRQWHAYHVVLDELDTTSEHSEEIAATGINCEKLLLSLTASYAEMLQRWIITPCDEMTYKLAVFKNITHATLALRRAEIQKARLELDARRLDLLAEKQRNKSASTCSSQASSTPETTSTEPIGKGDSGASRKEASRASSAETPSPAARPSTPNPPRSESPAPPNGKPSPAEPIGIGTGAGAGGCPGKGGVSGREASCPTAPAAQTSGNRPAAPALPPIANSQPAVAPAGPARLSTRPGFPPRNATPRNPLGLL
jgi:hypothetical protein